MRFTCRVAVAAQIVAVTFTFLLPLPGCYVYRSRCIYGSLRSLRCGAHTHTHGYTHRVAWILPTLPLYVADLICVALLERLRLRLHTFVYRIAAFGYVYLRWVRVAVWLRVADLTFAIRSQLRCALPGPVSVAVVASLPTALRAVAVLPFAFALPRSHARVDRLYVVHVLDVYRTRYIYVALRCCYVTVRVRYAFGTPAAFCVRWSGAVPAGARHSTRLLRCSGTTPAV